MEDLWSGASYEAHLLSLPFALAPTALMIVIAYAAVMRGAPALRGWLLAHCCSLLPYSVVMMLSPSITSATVAEQLFRIGVASIPMAAATGTAFQLAMIRQHRKYRWPIWFLVANAAVWFVISPFTDGVIGRVVWRGAFWYVEAGPWAWAALVHTVFLSIGGFLSLGQAALRSPPSEERRQLRMVFAANLVTYAGLVDVGLAYGIGVFPLGWLLSGIGSLIVVRALVVEDLLRVRAVDTSAPLLVAHFAAGVTLAWIVLALLGPDLHWWVVTIVLALAFAAMRASIATIALVNRGVRSHEGPLDRLLAQFVARTRDVRPDEPVSRMRTIGSPATSASREPAAQIGQLAVDIVELGVGARPSVLLASEEDWGWTTEVGARLDDQRSPDPLLVSWLAEQRGPVFVDDLERVPDDLRELLVPLFSAHDARILFPIRSTDELLGLVAIPAATKRLRGSALEFVTRVAERAAESLLHARMTKRAALRAALAREVELAAAVQSELLPGRGPHVIGELTVVGSWQPATRCAGDFWGLHPLGDGRVLFVIGDVTGHGVASAMVTAAAVGACEVCVRRSGRALDLTELTAALDTAVRRVGGGQLAMTCFAAIVDPAGRNITYVSCGHTSPYLCHPTDAKVELHALVGRGNLLGVGVPTAPRVLTRSLEAGDVVVWYTDGVIEAQDPAGKPFGDRRLQQLLRRLDKSRLAPATVHDLIQAGVSAHRAGHPLADDETVVVARLALPSVASLEPSRKSSQEIR